MSVSFDQFLIRTQANQPTSLYEYTRKLDSKSDGNALHQEAPELFIDDSASNIISHCDAQENFNQEADIEYFVSPQNSDKNVGNVEMDQSRIKIDFEKVDSSEDCDSSEHCQTKKADNLKDENMIISECLS